MEEKRRTEINFAERHVRDERFPILDLEYLKDWELIRELMARGYEFENPATPDLLKALKIAKGRLIEFTPLQVKSWDSTRKEMEAMTAAIAKAEGQEHSLSEKPALSE